ncbi:MAG: NAD(P)-dependent glycerol-3-phosphate dehydrogenase [Planctomycetes bacterium]|nr:NAD(P)-dependent glycerol-3-phosphate dehydrogenase [Planctomycetota bacterium]
MAIALVLGDGGWGTALAMVLHRSGHSVRLWSAFPAYAEELALTRRNRKFLPEAEIPSEIRIGADVASLGDGAALVVSAVPTPYLRATWRRIAADIPSGAAVVSASKGIEQPALRLPSEIIREVVPSARIAVLSGPSHAEEVARALPTSVVASACDADLAVEVQAAFADPTFRVYTSPDPTGVELAGALKNIIAIACGISDGLGFGDNTRAALITRGMAEIARLGMARGAQRETFSGLAGIGDLIVTATSRLSRNHEVGFRLGRGETLEAILRSTEMVAEGVPTTRSAMALARSLGVELPITAQVHAVLNAERTPIEAVRALLDRPRRSETGEPI